MTERVMDILLIEDDEVQALRIKKHIDTLFPGSKTTTLVYGREIRPYLSEHSASVILLDLNLPDVRGVETFDLIKTHVWDFPVIVLTVAGDEELALRLLEFGAQDFLSKQSLSEEMLRRSIEYSMKRHHVLTELETARAAAEVAVRARRDFLAQVGHELRTPLNGVIGFADLLALTKLDDEQRSYVDQIIESGQQQLTIVNEILSFTESATGKLKLMPTRIDIREWLSKKTAMCLMDAEKKGLEFFLKVSETVPTHITVDSGKLSQVVTNLVDNAIKFTRRGGMILYVDIQDVDKGKEEAVLKFSMSDSGIGVPNEKAREIFEPFVQLHDVYTRPYGGIGLGLSIVSEIVNAMGGRVWIDSAVEVGSVFHFTCRVGLVAEPKRAPTSEQTKSKEKQSETNAQGKKIPKVLVVEDNAANAALCATLLRKYGVTSSIAVNGLEALLKLERESFDLVLMDIQMPVMDGFETTRRLRERERELGIYTPIVALTAHILTGDRERCLNAGADDYLTKPIKIQEFNALLDKHLSGSGERK